jgi:hypothetical protein
MTLNLDEGRRLLAGATPGPWAPDPWGIWQEAVGVLRLFDADAALGADADLIAWLRNNAEALIAAAEERDRLREALESALERETAMNPCACPNCVEWRDQARAALSPNTAPAQDQEATR